MDNNDVHGVTDPYYPGKECICGAYGKAECACGVDWTDAEVYVLRKEIAALTLEVERLTGENVGLLDLLRGLMSEFDEPDEYMTVFQEAQKALEQGN